MLAHHLSRMFQKDFCSRKWRNRMMQWMNFRALLKLFQICGYSLRAKINYTEKTTAQSSQLPCLLTSAYSLHWQGWASFFTRAGLCCHEAICPCSDSRTAWVAVESKGFSYLSVFPFIHSFMAQFCEGWSWTAFERAIIKCFFFFFFFFKDSLQTKERDIAILGQGRSMTCLAGKWRLRQSFGSRTPSNGF